jgi:hypothetical protein
VRFIWVEFGEVRLGWVRLGQFSSVLVSLGQVSCPGDPFFLGVPRSVAPVVRLEGFPCGSVVVGLRETRGV